MALCELSAISISTKYQLAIGVAGTVLVFYLIYNLTTSTDIPYIKEIPEIPGALPIFGHLLALGDDHATVCESWWRKYRTSVFQIRLGNTRAVVVNSFSDAKRMLTGSNSQSALISRPTLYTFHGVISSTQGFTIGSSPWDESCKNKRKAAGAALGRARIKDYHDMFDLESYAVVRDLERDGKREGEISIRKYIQRYALNTTLTLCYGIRMDSVYDEMLREILEVGSAISLLRSAIPNNEKNRRGKDLRDRRDAYLTTLLNQVRSMIAKGTDKPCIASAILKDLTTKLTNVEVSSICLSLVSGGFETIPGTLTSCIGSLSTLQGQVFQEKAFNEIMRVYKNDRRAAWQASFQEEKVEYLGAIVKEALRYYTVSAMSLPRKTVEDIDWEGAKIPRGTMVLINAQAANHDIDHFGPTASQFNPDRWLSPNSTSDPKPTPGIQHFSFGAGSRACSGQIIATRLLYTTLLRLITSYRIVASESHPPNTDYVDYNQFKSALVAIPRDFKVRLVPRDGDVGIEGSLEDCLEEARGRTEGYYKEDLGVSVGS
ncbi:hypothetical protein HYFRA_00012488 [Hymenoscyphus fraxineus]|uniref:Phenylacetate 2-hydroxylase n=1 Tax=Hymenoscyphus fraxineus TaxID=746836 RepID=A0A9N9PVS1_9HELO|nr:hypothetical protein HYFRA_00012488 [Hymenoscyphus fraxineus]